MKKEPLRAPPGNIKQRMDKPLRKSDVESIKTALLEYLHEENKNVKDIKTDVYLTEDLLGYLAVNNSDWQHMTKADTTAMKEYYQIILGQFKSSDYL